MLSDADVRAAATALVRANEVQMRVAAKVVVSELNVSEASEAALVASVVGNALDMWRLGVAAVPTEDTTAREAFVREVYRETATRAMTRAHALVASTREELRILGQ